MNYKNNIFFILGIGIAGHKLGTELEQLVGISSDQRIIAIIEDSNSLLHQGTYHVEEGEKILQEIFTNPKKESFDQNQQLLYEALEEYKLAKFSIEKAISEFEIVKAKAGPLKERADRDLTYLKSIILKINETISDIERALKIPKGEESILRYGLKFEEINLK